MTVSTPLAVIPENIPEALRPGKRFLAWRYETRKGQRTKVPYSPNAPKGASSTDPSHWISFDEAVKYARVAGLDGIGIVVTHEAGLAWLDLDHCRDPETGEIAEWAAERRSAQLLYGAGCFVAWPDCGRNALASPAQL